MTWRKWRLPSILWLGGNSILFAIWGLVRECTEPPVGSVFTGAAWAAFLASFAFAGVLIWPRPHWLRKLAVAAPVLTAGLRGIALVLDEPTYWLGVLWTLIIMLAFTLAGPAMMPPPVTNGHAKAIINGGDSG